MILDRKHFDESNEEPGTLVAFISDLQLGRLPVEFGIRDGDKVGSFVYDHKDESGGDIAGWHFKEEGGSRKVLIIND
jgi:hypothetical protein